MKWILPAGIVVILVVAAVLMWNRPEQGDTVAAGPAAESNGIVPFRMEQQWLIRLKLAVAEETPALPQIYSTGRVVASPSNRALVAPRRHYREPNSSANRTARYKRPDPGDTRTDTNSRGGRADPH